MSLTLVAERRTEFTRSAVNRLRKQGRVPGVLYGKDVNSLPLHVSVQALNKILPHKNELLELVVEDQKHQVLIREVQQDIVTGNLLHVDFFAVQKNQPVDTEVPLELVGEAKGTKMGGVLEHILDTVPIRALPEHIPAKITIDISDLEIGDTVTLEKAELDSNIELLIDPDTVVASIVPPQLDEAVEESESTEAQTV